MYKNSNQLIILAMALKLKEGDIIPHEKSPCCNDSIRFTESSGVYVQPGVYCKKCHKLIGDF